MKSFWGYVEGKDYNIGTTGGTVCVYDKSGKELSVLKCAPNSYYAAFVPGSDKVVAKSAGGVLSVFSLSEMQLLKKIRFSKCAGQDNGFCFSKDGSRFYNIEVTNGLYTVLTVYETEEFNVVDRFFEKEEKRYLCHIELCNGQYVLFGYMRNFGVISCGFVAFLEGDKMRNLVRVPMPEFDYAYRYKAQELLGFTERAKKWLPLPVDREFHKMSLADLF